MTNATTPERNGSTIANDNNGTHASIAAVPSGASNILISSAHNNNNIIHHVEPATDALEERVIDAEYKIWKKNTPYLYDFVLTHSLEWPSLTCQWLPGSKPLLSTSAQYGNASEHSLLLGTHTTGEQNFLMVATCVIPSQDDEPFPDVDTSKSADQQPQQQKDSKLKAQPPTSSKTTTPRYDEEKKEFGGHGYATNPSIGKIEIKIKIKHEGEVNRARYMPQNHFIVATRGPSPELYIWDLSKHTSFPADNSVFCPQGVCMGHEKEGYAMAWSKHTTGHLLSGSEDQTVRLWDINNVINTKGNTSGIQTQPITTLAVNGHTDTVEDVDWHSKDHQLVISVGDDRKICIWDLRVTNDGPKHCIQNAHESDINCVAFNPVKEHLFATGSADSTVAIWDMRNTQSKLHSLASHNDQVFKVEWSPFNESILGSCSADRRVILWDLSRIGLEQSPEDAEDGPPELLFIHGGHTSKVSDFAWNPADHWTISSVSEDNVLQVWNIAEELYADDANEDNRSSGAGEDGMLGDDELE